MGWAGMHGGWPAWVPSSCSGLARSTHHMLCTREKGWCPTCQKRWGACPGGAEVCRTEKGGCHPAVYIWDSTSAEICLKYSLSGCGRRPSPRHPCCGGAAASVHGAQSLLARLGRRCNGCPLKLARLRSVSCGRPRPALGAPLALQPARWADGRVAPPLPHAAGACLLRAQPTPRLAAPVRTLPQPSGRRRG